MGSTFAFPLPYVPGDMPLSHLPKPTHGWPSINLVNQYTEFPVYLLEVNASDTLPTHHELFVDLSVVYGLAPVSFGDRTPDGKYIPVCGAVFHMAADIIPTRVTTSLTECYASQTGPYPMAACTFYLAKSTDISDVVQRVQLLGTIRDINNVGQQTEEDGTIIFNARLWVHFLDDDAATLFEKSTDADGNSKPWGPDWHCQIFANQLAGRWNLPTDYPHHGIVEAPVAEGMLQAFCRVVTIFKKTVNTSLSQDDNA